MDRSIHDNKVVHLSAECYPRPLVQRTEKDHAVVRAYRQALRFHAMITAATGNQELCRVHENIQQKTLLCRLESYELSAAAAPDAHTKIYQALQKDSKREARLAMREHIVFVRDRLISSHESE